MKDNLQFFANRFLLMHITARGGLGSTKLAASDELLAAMQVKNELIEEFAAYVREGDELATPAEFIRRLSIDINRVSPLTPQMASAIKDRADTISSPFASSYADNIQIREPDLFGAPAT